MNEDWGSEQLLTNELLELLNTRARHGRNGDWLGETLLDDKVADRLLLFWRGNIHFREHHLWGTCFIETFGFVFLTFKHFSPRGLEFSAGLGKGV